MLRRRSQERQVSERQEIQVGTTRDSSIQMGLIKPIMLISMLTLEVLMVLSQSKLTEIQPSSLTATIFSKTTTGNGE
jgi:hypothetical protein